MSRRSESLSRGVIALSIAACVAVLGAATALAFDEYLERRDTITLGVGDSIAVNKATQTINRWPKAARQDHWVSDGERARIGIERYRRRSVQGPTDLGSAPPAESPTTDGAKGATTQ